MNKKETKFNIEYVTEDDIRKNKIETIKKLTEDQKSVFVFNNEALYETSSGHSFLYGFYTQYITKSGIVAVQYLKFWSIDNDDYTYIDDEFIKTIVEPYTEPSTDVFNSLSFPIVKNVQARTISDDLVPVTPKLNK